MQNQPTPALTMTGVEKLYTQWQRSNKVSELLRNLIHPQKRTIAALHDLNLTVQRGEFVAYAGANGAGKSTTIKILSGILQPTQGSLRVLGMDPAKERIALMRRIGVLFGQRSELWWDHPVIGSFAWKKRVWNIPEDVYARNLAMVTELLDLGEILHTFARELSLGQRMRADLGMLLLHSPEVIFLDEPTLGLDVLAKQRMIAFLRQLNQREGTTILVTSHDMDDLEAMARRIVLLSSGSVAFDGSFDELRRTYGGGSRLKIIGGSTPPQLAGAQLLGSQGGEHIYAIDPAVMPVHRVLGALADYPEVLDVELQKAPIEDVIAQIYRQWKRPRG
ncbi:MAG: ABC transporter ATP-binding protein [Christensenellales bacterium]|jgi:ABC-2 type transport system ATP-binding protein